MRGVWRFLAFAAVGAVGTLAHWAVLVALVEAAGADPVAGTAAGFLAGALVNYTLNRGLVFRSRRAHAQALPRFLAVAGSGFVGNALLMAGLTHGLDLPYPLAQVLTTGVLVLWHYWANSRWTFRPAAEPER